MNPVERILKGMTSKALYSRCMEGRRPRRPRTARTRSLHALYESVTAQGPQCLCHTPPALLAGLVLAVAAGAVAAAGSGTSESGTRYQTLRDIGYYREAAADEYMREKCRLDLYYPENKPEFATVIWFHAGGLKQGSRYVPGELMNQGFAVAAVDYRLSPKVSAPDYIEDGAAATAWMSPVALALSPRTLVRVGN